MPGSVRFLTHVSESCFRPLVRVDFFVVQGPSGPLPCLAQEQKLLPQTHLLSRPRPTPQCPAPVSTLWKVPRVHRPLHWGRWCRQGCCASVGPRQCRTGAGVCSPPGSHGLAFPSCRACLWGELNHCTNCPRTFQHILWFEPIEPGRKGACLLTHQLPQMIQGL